MVFEWATQSPYTGGTVTYIETYRGYDIYFLGHWGLQFYCFVDPNGVEVNTFHSLLSWIKTHIDGLIGEVVAGKIFIVYYWIEGMAGWENLETYPTPAKVGDDIHLAVYWRNDGSAPAVGHILAQLTAPSEYYVPGAVSGQDRSISPGGVAAVQFAPVTLNEGGSWTFLGRLDLDSVEWVDYKQIPFAVEEAPVPGEPYTQITNFIVPTSLPAGAPIGELTPAGPYDGGTLADAVGTLKWYMPIDTAESNLVDAAIWEPYSPDLMSEEILEIGVPRGVGTVQVGDIVQKSGRTSGYRSAEVIDVNATVNVSYGDFSADFHNQIITDLLGDPGDSGSAVLDMNNNLVGLLFAGSSYVTIHNHIGNVLDAIGNTIPPTHVGIPVPLPLLTGFNIVFLSLLAL